MEDAASGDEFDRAVARAKVDLADDPRPHTWQEFLDATHKVRDSFRNSKPLWYRGHSQAKHKLEPSLLRKKDGLLKEQDLFDEYERTAARLLPDRNDDWERLIDMQHYGVPTRLLDWTDVLGIALAFALYDSHHDDEDSAIYILDPLELNRLHGIDGIKRVPNDTQFKFKSIYWEGRPFKANHPIAIDCRFQNARVTAQSGHFTVHGSNPDPIEGQASHCVRRIIIGSDLKPAVREFLEHANLNPFSIYPDIVGMAKHISRKHLGD